MTTAASPHTRGREMAAPVRSTHAVFADLGLAGATWVSRLPQSLIPEHTKEYPRAEQAAHDRGQ